MILISFFKRYSQYNSFYIHRHDDKIDIRLYVFDLIESFNRNELTSIICQTVRGDLFDYDFCHIKSISAKAY